MREGQLAKIVVIEDDLTFLDLLRVHLAGAGHEVLTAEDAVLGLRAIIASAPDLILLDLAVPYLDGFEMIEALRTDPATRNIPVIVLTGRGDDETYSRARELGAAQLLTKPVERDLLMRAIDGQLGSSKPHPGKK
ncbi:MAG: response regulator [Betaproteobacteria bacterium]|nr:MAG: response regulator [Betaproteobacteria bacterium]TMH80404.1 MAG: response regulator [Betaproteobacteria bacterium]